MTDEVFISFLALLVSVMALIASIFSYFVSKKSLKLTQQQHDERELDITLYFIEAYKWQKEKDMYISFALRVTNQATLTNSIPTLELTIEHHDENNIIRKVKLSPTTSVTPLNLKDHTDILHLPLNISPKSAQTGWVTFLIPKAMDEYMIDLYKITAETINKKTSSIDTHIINEI